VNDAAVEETAIEELLRYTSPVEITPPRLTREEVRLASVTIPKGELVAAVLGSANRDPSRFTDPETLDIGRAPNPHLALGQGTHSCLGSSLAQMEGRLALTTLFRRFPGLRLAQPPDTLRWRKILPLRGLRELPVLLQ
jgi:cytochrome P450 PksS